VLEAATGSGWTDLAYHNRRAGRVGKIDLDVSRTGYTGDLGYELWVGAEKALELWDRLIEAGRTFAIRPAGMLALDMTRVEAGLILAEVDYTSAAFALIPSQSYSPFEIGLGRLVNLNKAAEFVGRRALAEEAQRGSDRRLVGLAIDWPSLEPLYAAQGLSVGVSGQAWRDQIPVFSGGRQVGRATSGTWSPILKAHIALASVERAFEPVRTQLALEWTVEGVRSHAAARVVPLPFFDPPRKRA
jgi:aminomethyltransferase